MGKVKIVKNMRYWIIYVCVVWEGCICCSHSVSYPQDNLIQIEEETSSSEQRDSLLLLWNQIADSMAVLEKRHFHNDVLCHELIEKSRALNKEEKVFKLVLPSLSANHIMYFINKFYTATGRYSFSFWEKTNKNTRLVDLHTYRYHCYKKTPSYFKDEYGDSVKVYHKDEFNPYSDMFLSFCNKWDTTALMSRKDLLSPMREDEHILVSMVIMKEGNSFTIQCVHVIRNIQEGDQVGSPTFEIIRSADYGDF